MEDPLATPDAALEALRAIEAVLGETVADVLSGNRLTACSDDTLVAVLGVAAGVARRAEALMMESTAHIEERSLTAPRDERLTTRFGCRSAIELIERVSRVSSRTAAGLLRAGRAILRPVALSSGEVLPSEFPAMRQALERGWIGVDGVLAVRDPLASVVTVLGRAAHLAADEELAAAARGEGVDAAPPASADDLRALAGVWAIYLDQDGAEPRESRARRQRGLTLGVCRDGLVPARGLLLPDVAAQLQMIFDSVLSPRVQPHGVGTAGPPADGGASGPACTPSGPRFVDSIEITDPTGDAGADDARLEAALVATADTRTRAQKQHDALAHALAKVAGSGALPTLGGAAPTLVVSVRAEDMVSGRGFAHIEGCDEPVSLAVARQIACEGSVQRVISDDRGRIRSIEISDRVFAAHQRKAIALRDGGCIIPGCHVRASWCEIHHVHEHHSGGPTHTDNGVLLCWHHHRTLDSGGWKIRMNRGIPEVRGPLSWDPSGRWRAATTSPTRMRDRFARRT